MTRSRLLHGLPLVLGVLALLFLQGCWGTTESHGEDLSAEAAKTDENVQAEEEPRVTLYMTSWCGYCRKAQNLLETLDVPYVAKDVEESEAAAREYRAKAGGYNGIPLLDIDGRIVKGYQAELIHELVTRLKTES